MTPKVESVPSQAANNEAEPRHCTRKPVGDMGSSQKLVYPKKLKCRFRKSAAMMGLAISIGASSVLLSQMGDEALAAEPITAKSNATPKTPVGIGQLGLVDSEALKALATSQNVEASFALPEKSVRKILTANSAVGQPQAPGTNNVINPNNLPPSVPMPIAVPEQQLLGNQSTLSSNGSLETAQTAGLETNNSAESGGEELAKTSAGEVQQPTPIASQVNPSLAAPTPILTEEASSPEIENLKSPETAAATEEQQMTSSAASTNPATTEVGSATPLLPKSTVSEPEAVEPVEVYQVKRGDTLSAIAQAYGISISELLRMNNLKAADGLEVNQRLLVPANRATASENNSPFGSNNNVEPSNPPAFESASTVNIAIAVNKPLASLKPTVAGESGTQTEAIAPALASIPTPSEPASTAAPSESDGLETEISQLRERYIAQARLPQSNASGGEEPAVAIPVIAPTNNSRSLQPARQPANVGPSSLDAREQAVEISVPAPTTNARIRPTAAPAPVRPINYNRPNSPLGVPANSRPVQPLNRPVAPVRPASFGSQEVAAIEIPVPVPASNVIPRRRSQIAAAPTSTDDYNPMLRTPAGQPVSPQLPAGTSPTFNGLIWPAKGVLTSGYGMRWGRMHKGIDIAGPVGTPIFAAGPGIVLRASWNSGGYGNLVEIQHPDGTVTRYGHNSRLIVQAGQQIQQGQLIALMGSTGRSTGPHCHFEVRPGGGDAVNPMAYLPRRSGG